MAIIRQTVVGAGIVDGSITADDLSNSSITTDKIADGNITTDKIADSNITTAKVADGNITTDKIADSNITTAKVADNAITVGHMHSSVPLGTKNLLINGDMRIAQRGTSRTYGGGYKSIDRWAAGQYQAAGQEQVAVTDSNVPSKYALRASSSSTAEAGSGTRVQMGQIVESVNCIHCAGKQVTLSFWIRFSSASVTAAAGNFGYGIYEYDTADQNFQTTGASRDTSDTILNGSFPTTWTKYTKTITCASTMKNLAFRMGFNNLFNTTNNSDVWYELTGVQLEVGDTATPFEHRPYDMELARCQRYYQKMPQTILHGISGSSAIFQFSPYVEMRATPSLSHNSTLYIEPYPWAVAGSVTSATCNNGHLSNRGGDILVTGTYSTAPSTTSVFIIGGGIAAIAEL